MLGERVFRRPVPWLRGVLNGDPPPWAGAHAVAGLTLCHAFVPSAVDLGTVATWLDKADLAPPDEDPWLVRWALSVLRSRGLTDRLPPGDEPVLPPEAFEFVRRDQGAPPDTFADPHDLLVRTPEEVRRECRLIAVAGGFGARAAAVPEEYRAAARTVFPALTVRALRAGDLELGASLMRACRYLEVTDGMRDAAAFLAGGQRPDGRFGDFGPRERRVPDPDPALYLPVTVGCLWALAETWMPAFRLLGG